MYSNPWLTLSYGPNALNYARPLSVPPPAHGLQQQQHHGGLSGPGMGPQAQQPLHSQSSSVIQQVPTSASSNNNNNGPIPPGPVSSSHHHHSSHSQLLFEHGHGHGGGHPLGHSSSSSRSANLTILRDRNPANPELNVVPSSSNNSSSQIIHSYPVSSDNYDGVPASKQRDLLESLECPVCKDISPPPILNCANGHIICKPCRLMLPKCPICQALFIDTRNLSVEFISSLVQLRCTHMNCNQTIAGDKYKEHLDNCGLRPVSCYCSDVSPCSGKPIEFNQYERHLKEVHKLVGFDTRTDLPSYEFVHKVLDFSLKTSHLYYIKHSGKLFLLNMMIHKSNMFSWVSIVESETHPPIAYEASLTYYVKESQPNKGRCAWKIPIHSFRKSFDELENMGDLVAIPSSILIPLCGYSTVSLQRKRKIVSYEWRVTVKIQNANQIQNHE